MLYECVCGTAVLARNSMESHFSKCASVVRVVTAYQGAHYVRVLKEGEVVEDVSEGDDDADESVIIITVGVVYVVEVPYVVYVIYVICVADFARRTITFSINASSIGAATSNDATSREKDA
ncbi:hypothetical protein BGX34_002286 [Mortierella sp. NVP85]|nr:hypothetical protein BGX34_002286 [Mortierella sp. NVP85]